MSESAPNITGTISTATFSGGTDYASGCFTKTGGLLNVGTTTGSNIGGHDYKFDASNCSSIYGNSNNIVPLSTTVLFYIKY